MLFKRIEICNFGRYRSTNFFDTTVTTDRNVILVKAKNDRGKTTLFQAIKFALYGDDGLRPISSSEWINFQAASEGDGEMYVEIKFEHEDSVYRLKRLIKFRQTERGKEILTVGNPTIDLFMDDNPYMASDSDYTKQDWIDTILPKDASQFFFFDGEEIQKYIQKEAYVRQAIERVLGIKELLNAQDDLQKVLRDFQSEYDRNIRKLAKDKKSQTALDKIQSGLENVGVAIDAEKKSYNGAVATKSSLDKDLKKHEAIKDIVEQRADVEEELKKLQQNLDTSQKDLAISRGNISLVLLSPLLTIINRTEEDPPSVDRWQSDVVKYIIEHLDECVCNRPIDQHAKNVFRSKMLNVKPSKTSILKKFVNHVLIEHAPAAKLVELQNSLENVANITQDIAKQKSTLVSLNKQIRGDESGARSIKELQTKYDEVVKDIGRYEENLEIYGKQKTHLENSKKDIEQKINSSVVDEQLALAEFRKNMCETVANCIEQSIEKFYETRKPVLEQYISNTFSSLTNNPDMYRGLKIGRDFDMRVMRNDGTELPTYKYGPSAGASQIIAISMIGGLNKFATRDAPVVIDTPLGRLDLEHRKNLINYYSKMSKQIIILYQPSELEDSDIQHIHQNLASEWEIDSMVDHSDLSSLNRVMVYYE